MFLRSKRAHDLPQTTLKPRPAQRRLWEVLGELAEGLEELWESSVWEALGEPVGGSGGALGELWEALYIEKLPINRPKRPLC